MEFVKKHWVWFAVGGGLVLAYVFIGRSPTTTNGFVSVPPSTGPVSESKRGPGHF